MPPYVWMPPVCTQHKESMLVRIRGCPYAPINLDAPICLVVPLYVWTSPLCYDAPCMFGCLLYVWTPPHVWTPPICLDAPYVWTPHVWMPPCMFADLCMFGCHICLDFPVCLNALQMYGASKGMVGIQRYGGHLNIWQCQNVWGHPNILGHPNIQEGIQTYWGVQTYMGYPNIQGASKHMGVSIYNLYNNNCTCAVM